MAKLHQPTKDEAFVAYAAKRGLNPRLMAELGLSIETAGDYKGWLRIAYRHLSGEWEPRYRSLTEKKYRMAAGNVTHLYNPLGLGPNAAEVWVCEGEIDAITMIQYGLPAIGVPGAHNWKEQYKYLFEGAAVIIAYDADDTGNAKAYELEGQFHRTFRFQPPDGQDLNEWHLLDPDGLQAAIDSMEREVNGDG